MVGEWLALLLVPSLAPVASGTDAFNEIFYPIAERLLERCDTVLRVGGPSRGTDQTVEIARERGLSVFRSPSVVPGWMDEGAAR